MKKIYLRSDVSYNKKLRKFINEREDNESQTPSKNTVVIYTEFHTVQFN